MNQPLAVHSTSVLLIALWEALMETYVEIESQIDKVTPKAYRIILGRIRTGT